MKKVFTILTCLLLVVCSATLVACGCHKEQTNDRLTVADKVNFGSSQVEFANDRDFRLDYEGHNSYKAEGKASIMSAEQATAWGTVEGSKYVIVHVKKNEDDKIVFGWRNKDTMTTEFKDSEIDGNLVKNTSADDYILALTDGTTPRHPEQKVWRIEITEKDKDMVAYTIDFSKFYE